MKRDQIIKLLRSGEFTIAYHDNGQCCLYKGKHSYAKLPKQEVAEYFDHESMSYLPEIVELLCDALKGKSTST